MSKTKNKFSREVRAHAVRMVDAHRSDFGSEWAAMTSIAGRVGRPATLPERRPQARCRAFAARPVPCGSTTTTMSHPNHHWRTERRHKRVGRSCIMEASHPTRLCRQASKNIKPADPRYDCGTSGGQVRLHDSNETASRKPGALHFLQGCGFC